MGRCLFCGFYGRTSKAKEAGVGGAILEHCSGLWGRRAAPGVWHPGLMWLGKADRCPQCERRWLGV